MGFAIAVHTLPSTQSINLSAVGLPGIHSLVNGS